MSNANSIALIEKAGHVIPGGVNSPVRAFNQVGGLPVFMAEGDGAHVTDVDGNRYVDFIGWFAITIQIGIDG